MTSSFSGDRSDDAALTAEERRLREAQWGLLADLGTVPERSAVGHRGGLQRQRGRWSYFTHDQARSRAYRWGEDGIAGISDDQQTSASRWRSGTGGTRSSRSASSASPTRGQPRRGREGVLLLPRQPADAHLSAVALQVSAGGISLRRPGGHQSDPVPPGIGIRAHRHRDLRPGQVFDVEVEYAKSIPEDMVCRVTVHNRSAQPGSLHVLPTLWFRNTWSWSTACQTPDLAGAGRGCTLRAEHPSPVSTTCTRNPKSPSSSSATTRRTRPGSGGRPNRPRFRRTA